MAFIIDLIIIAIILLCIFLGYRKGLIGAVVSLLSFIIAVIVAFILYVPISNYVIEHTTIDDNIYAVIVQNLGGENPNEVKSDENNNTSQTMTNYINNIKNEGINTVGLQVTNTIIKVATFLILFIIVKIALFFVKAIANLVAKIPVLKQVNELGGVIYGALKGFFIVYLVLAVFSLIAPMVSSTEIFKAINNSFIGEMMYNNNILLTLLFRK